MNAKRFAGAALIACFSLLSTPSWAASSSPTIYCCTDDRGRQACGDILPGVCVGRAYREIDHTGTAGRIVEAPLTPEQKVQRAAEEKRKQAAEDAAREQKRMDAALLQTYISESDINLMQQRAEEDIQKSIRSARAKIDEIAQVRKKFENEAEFYKKKNLPPEVDKGIKDANFEIKAQEELIASKMRDLQLVKAKYDEDRRRFRDLMIRTQRR